MSGQTEYPNTWPNRSAQYGQNGDTWTRHGPIQPEQGWIPQVKLHQIHHNRPGRVLLALKYYLVFKDMALVRKNSTVATMVPWIQQPCFSCWQRTSPKGSVVNKNVMLRGRSPFATISCVAVGGVIISLILNLLMCSNHPTLRCGHQVLVAMIWSWMARISLWWYRRSLRRS